MNTKKTRFVLALLLAISVLGVSATSALASPPDRYEVTFPSVSPLNNVCQFDIQVDSISTIKGENFFDNQGLLKRMHWHFDQQDTFTANGHTLIGIPYASNVEWYFDSSGNPTHIYWTGVGEKILLPDGSLFISAGRLDFVAHGGWGQFFLSTDQGNPGDVAAFCAALAP
jgi:hypothetical protein